MNCIELGLKHVCEPCQNNIDHYNSRQHYFCWVNFFREEVRRSGLKTTMIKYSLHLQFIRHAINKEEMEVFEKLVILL